MKHAAKEQTLKKKQRQIKRLKVLIVLFFIVLAVTAITIYRDYQARPGILENVWITERGADYITISWEKVRNVNRYVVMYDGKTSEVSGRRDKVTIRDLEENRPYEFSVRADSRERKGFEPVTVSARTKKSTHIEGEDVQTKFANRQVDLKQTAETEVTYEPGYGYTVTPEGKIVFTRTGEIKITAVTEETEEYASVSKEITVNVLETVYDDPAGSSPHIFYELDKNNCECVMTVDGDEVVKFPQSFAYHDGEYILSFINKAEDNQRIIVYGDQKNVYEPEVDLGHANGLTTADGVCYSVRGGNSTKCIVFDAPSSNYGSFDLDFSASGIAYDQKTSMFFTSSRKDLAAYDSNFNLVKDITPIKRRTTYYVQDCGAYDGILMHCVSGEDTQQTNYIDFYDMETEKYLGSAECELNEIESLIVDDEGYIEVVCIGEQSISYIWKTPINIKNLCE